MYYVLMNDYGSSLIPRYLNGIIDSVKQVSDTWDYENSKYSFPYDMRKKDCPDKLFLLCKGNVGALKFPFYHHGVAQIVSGEISKLIKTKKTSYHYSRELVATSIKDGHILRDDMGYYYFSGQEGFIDFSRSKLDEDKLGSLIPYSLVLFDKAQDYDIFSINETLLAGFLFVSGSVVDYFYNVKGIKVVSINDALEHYCIDYKYDIESNRKAKKKTLP